MLKYSSNVLWSEEDRGFIATCPEIPGVSAFGEAAEEAILQLKKAIKLAVETYKKEGWELPAPRQLTEYSGQFRLRLPKSLHAWLVHEAEHEGVSLNTYIVTRLAEAHGKERDSKTKSQEKKIHEDSKAPTLANLR